MELAGYSLSKSVSDDFNIFGNILRSGGVTADENSEILQWLSPLDPARKHQYVCADRVKGVGNWLLETNEFREWSSSEGGADKGILFCYGDPGAGKTYLSSLVIDSMCGQLGEEDIASVIFYCDFHDQQQQTTTNIMGAILKQLVVRGEMPGYVRGAFQKAKREIDGRGPRLSDIVRMLKQAIAALPQVFICIDALDECLPNHLPQLLGSLKDILQELPRTRIFVTGRPHVESEITRYFTTAAIVLISPKTEDIKRYLEWKLEMDIERDVMPDGLRADILRIIPEKISEIFLLVSLSIEAILGEVTISGRRRRLSEMTKGNHLGEAYLPSLERIKAQTGGRPRLGMEALMWVSNSERPLHASELCHALGVKIGSADLDVEDVPTIRTILACSLGLITVEASSGTVRLVHLTLQEHLSNNPCLFQGPHSMIADVCLTYLNFECVRKLSPTLSSAPSTFALAEYATCYWGKHIRREKMESVSPLALRLLTGFEQHISSQLLLLRFFKDRWWETHFDRGCGPKGFTGLHGAAHLGIVEIVSALLATKEWDINATDVLGRTALTWAAIGDHEDVVKILLQQQNVNPNAADTGYGGTPLWWAAKEGRERAVRLLLERQDVNPDTTDTQYNGTPLLWAAKDGRERIVRLLLDRGDVNPNTTDTQYGGTPLWWAAKEGCEGVVRLLLEREDLNPNATDTEHGRTPLWWAAKEGHEGVVRLLLEREDINPNTTDTEYGRTALLWAAREGREGIVRLLLGRQDIDPGTTDSEYGGTPLLWAAKDGREGVVRLLLDREDINPDASDTQYGGTPLWWAAKEGREGAVRLLLKQEDIDPNTTDTKYGGTPLWWAAKEGREGVLRLLLKRDDVNPDIPDLSGKTAIELAVSRGHARVVELLSKPKPSLSS